MALQIHTILQMKLTARKAYNQDRKQFVSHLNVVTVTINDNEN